MTLDGKKLIIVFAGRKGSGKNEMSKFVKQVFKDRGSRLGASDGLDIVGEFAFADKLKQFCVEVLGLSNEQVNGSDEEKNGFTQYYWDSVDIHFRKAFAKGNRIANGRMTARQVMQLFGTEQIRNSFGNVWASSTIRRIKESPYPINLITDCRFPDELEFVLSEPCGYVVKLTRDPYSSDSHLSENALNSFNWSREKCYILDNVDMTIDEQNQHILPILEIIIEAVSGCSTSLRSESVSV